MGIGFRFGRIDHAGASVQIWVYAGRIGAAKSISRNSAGEAADKHCRIKSLGATSSTN